MNTRVVSFSLALSLLGGSCWLLWSGENSEKKTSSVPLENKPHAALPSIKQKIPPEIRRIVDSGLHEEERIAAVRDLPGDLDSRSLALLFEYLENPNGQNIESWYLVCNEIMEIFRKRNMAPDLYSQHLGALIASQKADPIIRDYACQHLALWISGTQPQVTVPEKAQISASFETLLSEAANQENANLTLPGTVMNALTDAVLSGPVSTENHRAALTQSAMKILVNPNFSNINRATAIQAAARLHAPELREHCLEYARNSELSPDLRLSSIAAIGLIGSSEDAAFLQSFKSDPTFQYAASAALQSLNLTNP